MRRFIIDCDPGVDDALALLLAFASPEAPVEALTIVAGNVRADLGVRNALLTIAAAQLRTAPPVAVGARKPLEREAIDAVHVHGEDGLGDAAADFGQPCGSVVAEPAVDLILETVSINPGEVTLIALGPLTNLAQAFLSDPGTMALIDRIVIMGGALNAPGNVTPMAEYNFFADPEAARIVLGSGAPMTLVGLDVTRRAVVGRDELAARAAASGKPAAAFAERISRGYFAMLERHTGRAEAFLHDPLAVAVALDPSLVSTERRFLDVETDGRLTTGMLVADQRTGARQPAANEGVEVAFDVDAERFRRIFLDRVFG